ncbi:MAG TPA: TMEM175 family protein [Tepidisphaeraceae bacterium]|nr:TMEM175 family protein [Tepidisphaeraceae bacterium]
MKTGRLEAFSDGVVAIIITIMVLEMKAPARAPHLSDLRPVIPVFISYVLSFVNVGIYWNNHHHLLHMARRVNGGILWANLHLLFWLSLVPFVTAWMGENHFAPTPTALYGVVLLMAGAAYSILTWTILRMGGRASALAAAIGKDFKGKAALTLYAIAIPLAFVSSWIAGGLFVAVALMWLIPDRRIERAIAKDCAEQSRDRG